MGRHNTFGGVMYGEQNFYLTDELSQHLLTSDDKYKDLLLQWKGSVFILCLFLLEILNIIFLPPALMYLVNQWNISLKATGPDSVDMIFCLELQLEAL